MLFEFGGLLSLDYHRVHILYIYDVVNNGS